MAANPPSRLTNNDNERKDIPEYMKKLDSLNIFDNKYGLLKNEDKDIDDLYLESNENKIKLKNLIDKQTKNYIEKKLEDEKLTREEKNISNIKNSDKYKKLINDIKNSEEYKELEKKQKKIEEKLKEKQDDFDKRFNTQYLTSRDKRFNRLKKEEEIKLQRLNEIKYKKKLHEFTIGDFLISFKDNIFFVINALLNKNYDIKTYTENYRLLHIGLLIIFLCIILMILKFDPYKNNIKLK